MLAIDINGVLDIIKVINLRGMKMDDLIQFNADSFLLFFLKNGQTEKINQSKLNPNQHF